ncbi:uncharacterized protein LOC117341391 [Pecten maximus]|uniref:uncharacterized protein LOC117341391 n=1 Tax=Pecten maximus TaxID=6579 RepID=UPI00145893B0|nr:uncharacterized protein LOC117341391 [Pecten maximus]
MLTEEEKRRIDDVYYNFDNGGTFLSPVKVHQVLKSSGYHTPGLHKIRRYLQSLDEYSLQKPARRSFRRAPVEVAGPFVQYDVDLAAVTSLSKQNSGVRFLLVVIDVFSRFLRVEPVKDKTAKTVLDAFKVILNRGRFPLKLRTDKGSEFNNRWLKTFCRDHNIHYFTSQNETKANYAESH